MSGETYQKRERLNGVNTLLILGMLSEGVMYGYQLRSVLSKRSENYFNMREGTLYPLLQGLEKKGLVTSEVENPAPSHRPPRRYYQITEQGRHELITKHTEWSLFRKAVNNVYPLPTS